MNTITRRIDESFIKFQILNDEIYVNELFVHEKQRGFKLGYKLLDIVKSIAENMDVNVRLFPSPTDNNISVEGLKNYYSNYGFDNYSDGCMVYYV